jgi:calpain-5
MEGQLANGLVKGHSYAVTAVKHIELDAANQGLLSVFTQNEKIMMVRLQNPWGAKEWNGPWSDGAPEWSKVSEDQQRDLGLTFDEDGEFWMTWEDFCNNFTEVSVCHLYNTSFWSFSKTFDEVRMEGAWRAGKEKGHPTDRAGGCLNFKATALSNPQYRFDVVDDVDTIVISLTQKDIRDRRKTAGNFYMTIGMSVMRVEENRRYRVHEIMPSVGTSTYANRRSEFLELKDLKKGRYVLIPSTYAAGEEGEFFLRLYSSSNVNFKELVKHMPSGGMCHCCKAKIGCVTRVKILGGKDLKNLKTGDSEVDAYCIMKCEKEKVRTDWKGKNSNPKWDSWSVFWRRHPEKPITIKVYDANYLRDSFLGQVTLMAPVSNDATQMSIPVTDKEGNKQKGTLSLEVATYDDPMYL